MRIRKRHVLTRLFALGLVVSLLSVDASAVMKEVNVWGIRSINDEGNSDNRVTMEQLEDDYQDFDQTNSLREYFHFDQDDPTKADLPEALSWLIDKEIICRDQSIMVTGMDGSGNDRIPVVTIDKMDATSIGAQYVTRSDGIMYIYKAVFGPIDARTVGVETDNIRVDDGTKKTLYQMMLDHDYFTTATRAPTSIVQSESTGGDHTVNQVCMDTPTGHYDNQTVTSQGGIAGGQQVGWAANINNNAAWRYTPQGNKYVSMFGDTNIFISDVDVAQQGNTGEASQGLGITTGTGEESADATTEINIDGPNTQFQTGSQQMMNHNSEQHGWGGTGGLNQAVAIETDYKQVYYVPAADLMFYRTNDVVEIYIKAALSKGLLSRDSNLRTKEFKETFIDALKEQELDSWSPSVPAHIVNRSSNKLQTSARVKTPKKEEEVLGKNFTLTYHSNSFTLTRNNLFAGNSGYFSTEKIYKMDLYRLIYDFISGNEKKLSDLETEIVNYKYGMELEGVASTEEDTNILMYLIAKGILNFDQTNDFTSLYKSVSYDEFLPILYRVANPNARLDFSKIQLTDSETSWKAKGYAPQSTYIVPGNVPSTVQFVINPLLNVEQQDEAEQNAGSDEAVTAAGGNGENNSQLRQASVSYSSKGDVKNASASVEDLLNLVSTSSGRGDGRATQRVQLGNFSVGTIKVSGQLGDILVYGGYSVHPLGLLVGSGSGGESAASLVEKWLGEVDSMGESELKNEYNWRNQIIVLADGASFAPTTKHQVQLVNNLWAIATMRAYSGAYSEALKKYDEYIEEKEKWLEENEYSFERSKVEDRVKLVKEVRQAFASNVETSGPNSTGPAAGSILFSVNNPTTGQTNSTRSATSIFGLGAPSGGLNTIKWVLSNIETVSYKILDSNGKENEVVLQFDGASVTGGDEDAIIAAGSLITVTQSKDVETDSGGEGASLPEDPTSNDILEAKEAGADGILDSASQTGSLETQAAASTGSKVTQFVAGKEGFLSWSQIVAFNGTKTSTNETIQIERVSDLILYNKQTNTRAYFSTGSNAIALVGTAVVQSDAPQGVAFKDGDGVAAEYWYHIDAIRLLMNAKQESSVLSGLRGTALADEAVQNSLQTIEMRTESGHSESSLIGLKVLLSNDDAKDRETANGGDQSQPYFKGTWVEGNTRWGRYVSLSQANRAVNAISRRIKYQPVGQSTTVTAYALVIFEPCNIEETGSAKIEPGMSMQDVLDSAVQPPATKAGMEVYNRNMNLANAYANWIYGTSGKTLIQTGYLAPKAYLYYEPGGDEQSMPATVKGCLTDEQFENVLLYTYEQRNGYVCKLTEVVTGEDGSIPDEYKANYALSEDYRIMISGDRVYLSESACRNLSFKKATSTYTVTNGASRAASFSIGNTFKLRGTESSSGWTGDLQAMVIATSDDGMVRCQYGPIAGTPLKFGSSTVITDSSNFSDEGGGMNWKSSYLQNTSVNRLLYVKDKVIGGYAGLTYGGIYDTPMASLINHPNYIFDGTSVKIYDITGNALTPKTVGTVGVPDFASSSFVGKGFNDFYDALQTRLRAGGYSWPASDTKTWVTFEFSAFKFQVRGGVLTASDATTSDFLSPSLFTNLNDLIIDEMINTSNGAVPINEVPAGDLLKVGNGYYASFGDKSVREFIGYAHLANSTTGIFTPHLQDVAKSFADHYIRGGSQYINVSHYFSGIFQLKPRVGDNETTRGLTDARKQSLEIVASSTLKSDTRTKLSVDPDGQTTVIHQGAQGEDAEAEAFLYAPISISFQDVLLAYPSGKAGPEGAERTVWTICPDAENSIGGAFSDLPFFTNSIMDASLLDITTTMASANYKEYSGDLLLMQAFKEEFDAAFKGDLFTLARMLVFIVLVWLFLASWVCYGFYVGNLMPFIEAIRYPTRDRGAKGIDLFKIMSLGTISVDSDFKLGRFIQYDCIIAILLLVVWKSGNISF